jgi:hypothetical protein
LLFLSLAATIAALTAGCFPQEDSCNVKTDGIYFEYEAVVEGGEALGRATLWVGDDPGGTNLVMGECGDALAINGVTMQEKGSNPVYYEAAVDVADAYEFVFTREDEDPYTSTVDGMRPAVLNVAPEGDTISRATEFDVTWDDNDGGEILLLITGDCIWDYPDVLGEEVADNGSHTVPANGIEATDSGENESCTAEIELSREVDGVLDAALKGTIVGQSVGRSSFTTAP